MHCKNEIPLLENRPDVRQASLELEAAKLDVESTRAAFLPAVSLDAGLGYRAFDVTHLIATPESLVADLAGYYVPTAATAAVIQSTIAPPLPRYAHSSVTGARHGDRGRPTPPGRSA